MLFLSKVAALFVMPLGASLAIAFTGVALLVAGWRRSGVSFVLGALIALWLASTPLASRLALASLERQEPVRSAAETQPADVAILLGGALSPAIPPRREADLGDAVDRIVFAGELFKAGKVSKILVAGGTLPWLSSPGAEPEAETIRRLLISWGIPAEAIITAGESRTTAENAAEVAKVWASLGASSAHLVTSAAHMPRALATFRRAGIPVTPAPTDIRGVDDPIDLLDLLPDAGSLAATTGAAKEALGYAVYWLRGDL
ncbi:MAG: YdcF family protein [Verrucomicrobiaceae bacterium]